MRVKKYCHPNDLDSMLGDPLKILRKYRDIGALISSLESLRLGLGLYRKARTGPHPFNTLYPERVRPVYARRQNVWRRSWSRKHSPLSRMTISSFVTSRMLRVTRTFLGHRIGHCNSRLQNRPHYCIGPLSFGRHALALKPSRVLTYEAG